VWSTDRRRKDKATALAHTARAVTAGDATDNCILFLVDLQDSLLARRAKSEYYSFSGWHTAVVGVWKLGHLRKSIQVTSRL